MSDFIINDKWILDRISSQSDSFSNWLNDLIDITQKAVKEIKPDQLEEINYLLTFF